MTIDIGYEEDSAYITESKGIDATLLTDMIHISRWPTQDDDIFFCFLIVVYSATFYLYVALDGKHVS